MPHLEQRVKDHARALGFDRAGIVRAEPADDFDSFLAWLDKGYAGAMSYLERQAQARRHPASVLATVRSIVMLTLNYNPPRPQDERRVSGVPVIARYARGADYHRVLWRKLDLLLERIRQDAPHVHGRGVVDTAPLLERGLARRAGLGWFGKNTMLLDTRLGSYFFLAALLLDIDLEPDAPFLAQHCGTCTACLDACPTDAFPAPYQLDARRCISYLTIELRGPIDPELRPGVGPWLFGCDICQEVCPWNRKAPSAGVPDLLPRAELSEPDPIAWLNMTDEEYRARFRGTALTRAKRAGLRRNAAIVLGNTAGRDALPALRAATLDADETVAGAARWAIAQIEARHMPTLVELLKHLSSPAAYSHPVDRVIVHQTHISLVFVAGDFVYKIKKPLQLGFLDYSTLERRQRLCAEEVRLNRRLAPDVYLGVAPIVEHEGRLRVDIEERGKEHAVEWAVRMRRLPDEATLASRLERGEVAPEAVERLAVFLAAFHGRAERGAHIASFGRSEVVGRNMEENFEQTAAHVGGAVSREVYERVRDLSRAGFARLRGAIDDRARRGVPCDTHGDLRLEHVYYFPERPDAPWVIIDCIEFNERFRYADPLADVAFLAMDLVFHGRRDLAQALTAAYFRAATPAPDTLEENALFSFYTAYRAVVRAKVDGIKAHEGEVPAEERRRVLERGRARWLVALGELEQPERRPSLVLVAGLPGSGKSTLARRLADAANFTVHRSDVVRKELARAAGLEAAPYTPEWSRRTYEELARRAEATLWTGGRVLLDANFRRDEQRQALFDLTRRRGVPFLMLVCEASPETIRDRLARRHNDVSDAGWRIYQELAHTWEEPAARLAPYVRSVDADASPERMLERSLAVLERDRLYRPTPPALPAL